MTYLLSSQMGRSQIWLNKNLSIYSNISGYQVTSARRRLVPEAWAKGRQTPVAVVVESGLVFLIPLRSPCSLLARTMWNCL
ncbi:hypothetical protein SFRURICE_013334 [Spodoptera frugiperda]|nr:hypothetical protein SFRURICE_013334 [Spodoptera frugiperda]